MYLLRVAVIYWYMEIFYYLPPTVNHCSREVFVSLPPAVNHCSREKIDFIPNSSRSWLVIHRFAGSVKMDILDRKKSMKLPKTLGSANGECDGVSFCPRVVARVLSVSRILRDLKQPGAPPSEVEARTVSLFRFYSFYI